MPLLFDASVLMVFGAASSVYLGTRGRARKSVIYGIGLVTLLAQIGLLMTAFA